MAILSVTNITINGNSLPYYGSCNLHQEIGEHHTLDLHCLMETIKSFCDDNSMTIEDLLGAVINIETKPFSDLNFDGQLQFKGVITNLNYKKSLHNGGGNGNLITILANSPTILADDGPHYTSFNDMSFVDIINQSFNNYDTSKLSINTSASTLNNPFSYTVQYNESSYEFAKRLAARNGEWIYYNGEELCFGLENDSEEVELTLGKDLQDFSTSLKPKSHKFNYYTNDYLVDDIHEKSSSSINGSSDGVLGIINTTSESLYPNETKLWVNAVDDTNSKNRLDTYAEIQQNAIQTKQVILSGTSDNPGVGLGKTIKIQDSTYLVTKVSHNYTNNGEYENFFEATSSNATAYPNTNVTKHPKAENQTAKVIDNNDPDAMGRIKAQFAWQKTDNLNTPWMRIMLPHAGQDKGFHFIPEVGDEVLVGFEGGNAERPFVMGTLYNANAKAEEFKTDTNDVKIIRTRSGHTIELNDTEGEEKINIYDNEGSIITFDTQAKSLLITATENIELQGKNIKITAEENIELLTQGEIKTASEGDTSIMSQGATNLQADSDTSISSNASVTIEATNNAELKGQSVTIEGKTSTELNGAQTKVTGSAKAEVSGGIVKIN